MSYDIGIMGVKMEKVEIWEVRCRIISQFGNRDIFVREFENRDRAFKYAEVLQECADSNPRSNAVYYVRLVYKLR